MKSCLDGKFLQLAKSFVYIDEPMETLSQSFLLHLSLFQVCLIDGAARIFLPPFATAGTRTRFSRDAPTNELLQGATAAAACF